MWIKNVSITSKEQNIKDVQFYENPDTLVIIKGSPDHIICIPKKPIIHQTLFEILPLGEKVLVRAKTRVKNRVIAHKNYAFFTKLTKKKYPNP